MSKKLVFVMVLVVLVAVVLLYNMRGASPKIDVNLVFHTLKDVYKSLVFLGFTMVGVLIGLFMK